MSYTAEQLASPQIKVVQNYMPAASETSLKNELLATRYWSGKPRQNITPDIVTVNPAFMSEISRMNELESQFLTAVVDRYRDEISREKTTPFTQIIEGPLQASPLMQTLRQWTMATPPGQPVSYYRPDIGLTLEGSALKPYFCELNIITAGTPPAMVYREAQRQTFISQGITPATPGSLEFWWEMAAQQPRPSLDIIGVSPLKANQQLYEKSHTDMAELLLSMEVPAEYSRIDQLRIDDQRLITSTDKRPVELVYWRIPPFQEPTYPELTSPQANLLLKLYLEGQIKILPQPILAFMNNKALEVLAWTDEYKDLVPEGLRKYVPETNILDSAKLIKDLKSGKRNQQEIIIKKARGDGGVTLGVETRPQEFVRLLDSLRGQDSDYVIQQYIEPIRLPLQTRAATGQWKTNRYFLRIEPTVAVNEQGLCITDLFYTGRYDTRKVGGSSNCVMGVIGLTNDYAN